jgi:hypothetical protein
LSDVVARFAILLKPTLFTQLSRPCNSADLLRYTDMLRPTVTMDALLERLRSRITTDDSPGLAGFIQALVEEAWDLGYKEGQAELENEGVCTFDWHRIPYEDDRGSGRCDMCGKTREEHEPVACCKEGYTSDDA